MSATSGRPHRVELPVAGGTDEDLDHTGDDIEKTPLGIDLRAWLRATVPADLTDSVAS